MKYSDIISIRGSKAAYKIRDEKQGDWESFIPNDQFNEILRKVICSVRNNDINVHKSFWIEGTYGTGKSHASAVIKHLLSDIKDEIEDYVDREYSGAKFKSLREQLYTLRDNKRLFPVNMYAMERIAHSDDFAQELQSAIKRDLKAAGIDIIVKTDFDNYVEHIKKDNAFWNDLITKNAELSTYTPTCQKLINELQAGDTGTLSLMKNALRERGFNIRLDSTNITDWFFDVQDKLKIKTDYDGLLIVWDEFTDVMRSDVGPSILVSLQEMTERAMNPENDSYFLFISHPSALNNLDIQERNKTHGRYLTMHYHMETVSAFKIMTRKFRVPDEQKNIYEDMISQFFTNHPNLLERYIINSNDNEDTKNDLRHLFPMHPATANLATYYAREAGSSSRSVFEFIGENPAYGDFLNSEENFMNRNLVTANYLWDYVMPEFNEKVSKFGAVTERYNSVHLQVENKGAEYLAVFKGILLLNALNNVANNDSVTPSKENIVHLFEGTAIENNLEEILTWINEKSIIQKDPNDLYSIQFSALPTKEIEESKELLKQTSFKDTKEILLTSPETLADFKKIIGQVKRPLAYEIYSYSSNEYVLKSQIENGRNKADAYSIFVAMLVGRTDDELNNLRELAKSASADHIRFDQVIFFVFDAIFGVKEYERYIEYQANAICAAKHNLPDQQVSHRKNAFEMARNWVRQIRLGNFTCYCQGEAAVFSATKIASTLNGYVAPRLYPSGLESLDTLRNTPTTFWYLQMAGTMSKNVFMATTLTDLNERSVGTANPVRFIFQDCVNENLEMKEDVSSDQPLWKVCEFVKKKIANADKSNEFNFADKFADLTKAPYGLYPSLGAVAMLAFALRPYVGKIFDTNGKPRKEINLADDVMETFKVWQTGKGGNKVSFMFETKEAGKLSKNVIKLFNLTSLKGYSDISSLKDARWAIANEYMQEKGYPLWSLKYADCGTRYNEVQLESIRKLIDLLVIITTDANINKRPDLMTETLDIIERYKNEFRTMLNSDFKSGFVIFLQSQEDSPVQDNEVEETIIFIRQNLQGAVGYWTEDKVKLELLRWAARKNNTTGRAVTDVSIIKKGLGGEISTGVEFNTDDDLQEKAKSARNAIQTCDREKLVKILTELCDLLNESAINHILENN